MCIYNNYIHGSARAHLMCCHLGYLGIKLVFCDKTGISFLFHFLTVNIVCTDSGNCI